MKNDFYKKSGVYFIRSKKTNKIVYIGHSSTNLKKTLYRHFQNWNDKTQVRQTYESKYFDVRIIETTPKKAQPMERYLIKKFQPRDNTNKYKNEDFSKTDEQIKTEIQTAEFFNNSDIIDF